MRNQLPEVEREKILRLSQDEIFQETGREALTYLKEVRKFDDATIKKFCLGYMPEGVHNILGEKHELSGRIIFPIFDAYGQLVAFSSRDWRKPKSFWHESFEKSQHLYALPLSKRFIIQCQSAIMVEGEFDTMMLHQFGIENAVGILGSSPQLYQIALLRRYCKEIYIVFDGDKAGKSAIERVEECMADFANAVIFDMKLIPVYLPDNLDPDDFLKQKGKNEFFELLKKSKQNYVERTQ